MRTKWGIMMLVRRILPACLIAVMLLGAVPAFAGVISEDIAYWYRDENQILTKFNPDTEWLNENLADLVIKVQQTVYDVASCNAILARAGQKDKDYVGYLWAYTVTNLNWGDLDDLTDFGLTGFTANWGDITPQKVTTTTQTPANWVVDTNTTNPAWKWNIPDSAGLLPGESAGGLIAVGPVAPDGVVPATATRTALNGAELVINGQTTGPQTPDPGSLLTLMTGLVALGGSRLLRRR